MANVNLLAFFYANLFVRFEVITLKETLVNVNPRIHSPFVFNTDIDGDGLLLPNRI